MLDRFLEAGRMAKLGQQLGGEAIQLIFAFEEHAIEVEDDRSGAQGSIFEQSGADSHGGCAKHYGGFEIAGHSNA